MLYAAQMWKENHLIDENGCWIWQGARLPSTGRPWKRSGRKTGPAYRYYYEHYVGSIPSHLQIDHLCRVITCCNPEHMELVTGRENVRRHCGLPSTDVVAPRKTPPERCKRGHILNDDTCYFSPSNGGWSCKKCTAITWKIRYERDKAKKAHEPPPK